MPYNKVVVPLDGSKLAEIALPHVEEIAAACHVVEVALVSVTESLRVQVPRGEVADSVASGDSVRITHAGQFPAGKMYVGDSMPLMTVPVTVGRMAKAAKNYLVKIAVRMEKKGLSPKIHVLVGNIAEEIVKFAEEENADLIIMASHGRSGLSHWSVGSVAEKVFRATNIPVLLVKPEIGFKETKPRRKGKPF